MEITPFKQDVIIQTPVLESERQFNIPDPTKEPELANFITNALVRNLYSNPVLAFIRESIQNAIDAMRINNTLDKGIYIHIPTQDNPKLSITDFGPGISKETFDSTYGQLGFSSKRNDNSLNGGFGIGRLTILAASEQGYIRTVNSGYEYVYFLCLKDNYTYQLLSKKPSSQPTGTTVEIVLDLNKNPSLIDSIDFYVYCLTSFLDCPVNSNSKTFFTNNSFFRNSFTRFSIPNTPISYKVKYSTAHFNDTTPSSSYYNLDSYCFALQIGDITYYNFIKQLTSTGLSSNRLYVNYDDILSSEKYFNYVKTNGFGYSSISDLIDFDIYSVTDAKYQIRKVWDYKDSLKVKNLIVICVPPNYIQLSTNRDSWSNSEKDKIENLFFSVLSHLNEHQNNELSEAYKPHLIDTFFDKLFKFRKEFINNSLSFLAKPENYILAKPKNSIVVKQLSNLVDTPNQSNRIPINDLSIASHINMTNATRDDIYTKEEVLSITNGKLEFTNYLKTLICKIANTLPGHYSWYSSSVLLPSNLSSDNLNYPDLSDVFTACKTLKDFKRHQSNLLYTGSKLPSDWYYLTIPCHFFDYCKSRENNQKNKNSLMLSSTFLLSYLTTFKFFLNSNIIFYTLSEEIEGLVDFDSTEYSPSFCLANSLLSNLPTDKPTVLIYLQKEFALIFEQITQLPFLNINPDVSLVTVTLDHLNSVSVKKEQKKTTSTSVKKFLNSKCIRQLLPSVHLTRDYISNIYDCTQVCTSVPNDTKVKFFMLAGHSVNYSLKPIPLDNFRVIAPFISRTQLYFVTPSASSFLKTQPNWVCLEEFYEKVSICLFKRYEILFSSINYTFSSNFFSSNYTSDTFQDVTDSSFYVWHILNTAYNKLKSRPLELLLELLQPDYLTALRKACIQEYDHDQNIIDLLLLIDPDFSHQLHTYKLNNSSAEELNSLVNFNSEVIQNQNNTPRTTMIYWLVNISKYVISTLRITVDDKQPQQLKLDKQLSKISGLTNYSYINLDYDSEVCPLYKLLFQHYPLLRWVFPILETTNNSLLNAYPLDEILQYMENLS